MATAAIASSAVRLVAFGKRYKKLQAVRDVSFAVAPGTLYGLLGPDGAGKSSILKSIAGVLSFEEGYLDVFDVRVDSETAGEQVKGRLGFMPQGLGLNLYPELTVDENVDFFADLRAVPRQECAQRREELFGITRLAEFRGRRMKHLSGGMKQKLGLVCALIHSPDLLVLDEPTTGVDPVSRRDFWTILSRQIHERGITAIVSTAYMDEASRFDSIAVMHNGGLLAEGTPLQVVSLMPGSVVSLRCPDQSSGLLRLRKTLPRADASGDRIRVRVDETGANALEAVRTGIGDFDIANLKIEEPDLEDTFVYLLSEKATGQGAQKPDSETAGEHLGAGAATSAEDAIYARRLTKAYGDFLAVDRVNLQVRAGQVFGLLGANGAGKTTVIKMLTGIVQPTHGRGQVAGADMRRAPLEVKRRIGYMSQSYSLYQDLTVRENIMLYGGIYGLTRAQARARADWIVSFGELTGFENARSGSLPLGLRQRLALGCALVHDPQVLFLDEPTSGVDPVGRRTIWDLLFHLAREHGVAILVTTHYMSEAEHCDQLALMHAGRIVANATPDDLKAEFNSEAGILLELAADPLVDAESVLLAAGYNPAFYGRKLHLLSRSPETDKSKIGSLLARAGITVMSFAPVDVSMEDVFVYRITELERRADSEQDEEEAA